MLVPEMGRRLYLNMLVVGRLLHESEYWFPTISLSLYQVLQGNVVVMSLCLSVGMSLRLINKYFYHSIWLAGGCAAIQSEVRVETSCNLRSILTWKFLSIHVTGVSLKTDTWDVDYLEVVIMNDN